MDRFIEEARAALAANMFTLALQGTLAIVDICAALGSEDGRTAGGKFEAWFSAHVQLQYTGLNPADVWQLRCGLLHQGRIAANQYSAIIFTLPDGRGNIFHNNVIDDALNLDLVTFCTDVLDIAQKWWDASRSIDPVRKNSDELVRIRTNGLLPYMVGTPVLA